MATVKTAISMEEALFREIERLARMMHLSRSRFIAKAAQEFIRKHHSRRLLEQINEAYELPLDAQETDRLAREKNLHRKSAKGAW